VTATTDNDQPAGAKAMVPFVRSGNPVLSVLDKGRWRAPEIAFWAFTVAVFFLFPDHLMLGAQVLITGLFALSLDLLVGYTGLVSLGHAAFFGVGAYAAGLLAQAGWGEPFSGLALAAAAAAVVGYASSHLIVRVHGIAMLMITMGVTILLHELANRLSWITGGDDGLQGVTMAPVLGLFGFDLFGRTAYLYALGVVFAMFCLARGLVNSPFGLSLRGIRENGRRMPAIGSPMRSRIRTVYTMSAALAGVAGALLAQTTEFVSLEVLSFQRSAEVLIILILGGTGRLYGALIGAAVFMVGRDLLASANPQYWFFWLGLMLVLVVMFARGGILGGLENLLRFVQRRRNAR